jgi:hypothetical protein
MSAHASTLDFLIPGTASQTLGKPRFTVELNHLLDALSDAALYEQGEPKPSPETIALAANVLSRVEDRYRNNTEIEPYWGQLSLIWRTGREKRVKATFGGDSVTVYHEEMIDGRVIDSGMETLRGSDTRELSARLAWL